MARVVWKGAISFGLVNIPIRLYTAVRDQSVHFHLLSEDGTCRLRRKLYCPDTGKEYDFNQTARGIEVAPDQYVLIDKEEIARLRPEKGHTIEIEDFVDLGEIDPVYYERPYYVGPGEGGSRPYRLLVQAMEKANRVGIARFVMRDKQHLAALRVSQGGLVLSTMNWHDEVAALPEVVDLPKDEVDPRQVELAVDLVERLTRSFEPDRYRDTFRERLQELIEKKAAGEGIPVRPEPEEPAEVVDLMEALRQSLQKTEAEKA